MQNDSNNDYLLGVQKVCENYYDIEGKDTCDGCPFQYNYSAGLECDSGVYNKLKWDIPYIKSVVYREGFE